MENKNDKKIVGNQKKYIPYNPLRVIEKICLCFYCRNQNDRF